MMPTKPTDQRKKLTELSSLIAELLETHKPTWTGPCPVCHQLPAWCPATRIVALLYPQRIPHTERTTP